MSSGTPRRDSPLCVRREGPAGRTITAVHRFADRLPSRAGVRYVGAFAVLVLLSVLLAGAGAAATPSEPTPGEPGELEVQLLDGDGAMVDSYQVDAAAGSINVTDGNGNWENTTLATANETALAIQWALDDSTTAGSTVLLGPGTYNGTVTVTADDRTIEGHAGPTATNLTRVSGADAVGIAIGASNVSIENLTVRDFGETGIFVGADSADASNAVLENAVVRNNTGVGINVTGSSATVVDTTVSDNEESGVVIVDVADTTLLDATIARNGRDGLELHDASDTVLERLSVNENWNDGVDQEGSSTNTTILDSEFVDNFYGVSLSGQSTGYNTIENSTFRNNDPLGIYVTGVRHNVISNNTFTGTATMGIDLTNAQHNTVRDNVVESSGEDDEFVGIRMRGYTRHVDVENNTIRNNLGTGIVVGELDSDARENSISGNEVVNQSGSGIVVGGPSNVLTDNVASENGEHGVVVREFGGNLVRNTTANGNGHSAVRLDGSADSVVAGTTVGDVGEYGVTVGNASHRAVVNGSSVGDVNRSIVVDRSDDVVVRDNVLAAPLIGERASSFTVRNNTLTDAGVLIRTLSSDAHVVDNAVDGPTEGIALVDVEDVTVERNSVSNATRGIALGTASSRLTVRDNRVADNGVGIAVSGSSAGDNTVRNNTVERNGVGIRIRADEDTVAGNRVTDSTAEGILLDGASATLLERNNASFNRDSGLVVDGSSDTTVVGLEANWNGDHDVHVRADSDRTVVEGANVTNHGDYDGVFVENSTQVLVIDGTFGARLTFHAAPGGVARNNSLDGYQITLEAGSDGALVERNEIEGSTIGTVVEHSRDAVLRANAINGSAVAVELGVGSENVTVIENVLTNSTFGVDDAGSDLGGHAIESNTVRDGQHGIRVTTSDTGVSRNDVLDNEVAGILVSSGSNVSVIHNDVRRSDYGVHLDGVEEIYVEHNYAGSNRFAGVRLTDANESVLASNTLTGNVYGVELLRARNNTVSSNAFVNDDAQGLRLEDAHSNEVVDNVVTSDGTGVTMTQSTWNSLEDNHVYDSEDGIVLSADSERNAFVGTNVSANARSGVFLSGARNNTFTDTVANDNDRWGIEVDFETVDNEFDGVTAHGNAQGAFVARNVERGTNTITGLDVGAVPSSGATVALEASNVSVTAFDGSPGTPADLEELGGLFEVENTTSPLDVAFEIRYTDADVSDRDESTVGLWNHSTGNWTELVDASHDAGANAVSTTLTGEHVLGLFAEESSNSGGGIPAPSQPRDDGSDDGPIELSFHDVAVSDDRVAPGEPVTVTVTVRNEDDRSGTRDLSLADGETVLDELSVSLDADEERRIEFAGEIDATGTYEFGVDGEHLATIRVVESESDEAGDAADGATDGEDGDEIDDATDDAAEDDAEDEATATPAGNSGGLPWLLLVLVLLTVAGAVGYVYRDELHEWVANGRERSALLRERLDTFRERRNGRR